MKRPILKWLIAFAFLNGSLLTAAEDRVIDLIERAQKGDADAQFNLGHKFYAGDGMPKDHTEAVKWYGKAAEQGLASAQFNLGNMYARGEGIPKDSTEAVKWYRKAAEQGLVNAQFNLGNMYSKGEGVTKDSTEAVKWWRKAAEQNFASAQFNLGVMYAGGYGVPKDSTEAVKWYRMAAEQNHVSAQFYVGVMYAIGEGAPKDSNEAVKWYRKAAESGLADAQGNLGSMYANGEGVPKDGVEAVKWYRKAAEQGEPLAQLNLGRMYASGRGVPKDSKEAVKWYRMASEQGHRDAQYYLGLMFATGDGVPKNTIDSMAWFYLAAASGDERAAELSRSGEASLGREMTLVAQQRSKEILKQIETTKRAETSATSKDSDAIILSTTETPKASGSGAIVSREGYVLTAAHVVIGASRVKIFTAQGTQTAIVLRIDEANDLAVLKLAAGTYPALPLVPSRRIRLGQAVATIGFPNVEIQGFSPKVTRGEISSLNGIGDDPRAWQISVPVQPGNSGGALLDENGSVIGVVVSKLGLKAAQATGDIPQNVNYAVKSTYALALLEPYLDGTAPEPNPSATKPKFEDMIAKAQQSVVLILVY